ncbi:hypothetical protein HBB16_19610 [Pseudonocardia sp. MCCB 268]|nr:hypothetical protein [Pseudonocardia cytotoxica]
MFFYDNGNYPRRASRRRTGRSPTGTQGEASHRHWPNRGARSASATRSTL